MYSSTTTLVIACVAAVIAICASRIIRRRRKGETRFGQCKCPILITSDNAFAWYCRIRPDSRVLVVGERMEIVLEAIPCKAGDRDPDISLHIANSDELHDVRMNAICSHLDVEDAGNPLRLSLSEPATGRILVTARRPGYAWLSFEFTKQGEPVGSMGREIEIRQRRFGIVLSDRMLTVFTVLGAVVAAAAIVTTIARNLKELWK